MGATVTRDGKTYYKGDDGKLYPDYNAAARAVESRRMAQPYLNNQTPGNVADQRSSMLALASGKPIKLRESSVFGAEVPGGPAYGAVRDGRQVLVQRGAAGTGANNAGSINFGGQTLDPLTVGRDVMWIPRNDRPTEIENRYGIRVASSPPAAPDAERRPPGDRGPGLGAPVAYGDPAARARESEQRRMMQQYASKEYWDTEQGKAMKDLAMQDRYEGKDLAKFYQAQQATGIGSIDEIVSAMGYTGDMEKWARANQGLALREYLKKSPKGFSNDPAMGTLPQGYENAVATYEAHGAPQISVDQAMQAELEKARKAGYSDEQIRAQLSSTQMGLPVGSEAGAVAAVNREKLQELQGIVPQAALTGAGKGAMSMQPESAVPLAVTYSAPQGLELGNIPKASSEEIASNLARVWNQKLRNGFANG